jgi:hypothetical protein
MNIKLFITILVALSGGCVCCGPAAARRPTFEIHYSGDFSTAVIYLVKDVALSKHTYTDGMGNDHTGFVLVRAHWVNAPELAEITGDQTDEIIVDRPDRLGMDHDGKWLVVTKQVAGGDSNASKVISAWAINLQSGKIYSAAGIPQLKSKLESQNYLLPAIRTEPAEVFFDRCVVIHYNPKATWLYD